MNGKKKRNGKKRQGLTGRRRSKKLRRNARQRGQMAVVAQGRKPKKPGPGAGEQHHYRDLVMVVFAFSSIVLLFLLSAFAFITKDAGMMRQIMNIVEIGLAATLGWAGGLG